MDFACNHNALLYALLASPQPSLTTTSIPLNFVMLNLNGIFRAVASSMVALTIGVSGSAQNLIVVDDDGGPGVDFTNLIDALAAAADGDVLLLKSGAYSGEVFFPTIPPITRIDVNRPVVIQAEVGAVFSILPDIFSVSATSSGETTVVRGIPFGDTILQVLGAQGEVLFEGLSSQTRVTVEDSTNAIFVDCTFEGDDNSFLGAQTALALLRSNAFLYGCTMIGGDDTDIGDFGTIAIRVDGGSLNLSGGLLQHGLPLPALPLLIDTNNNPFVRYRDGGVSASDIGTSTLAPLFGTARTLKCNSPIREGELVNVDLTGEPSDFALLFASPILVPAFDAGLMIETFLPPHPMSFRFFAGNLNAAGTKSLSFPLLELGLGIETVPIYLQGYFIDLAANAVIETNPSLVVLLDQSV